MQRAAIYTRISKDATGQGAGVARQEQECRRLAAERGWAVTAVYSDNDISAYSGKKRPGYESLLTAVAGGEVDVIVVWHVDRLYRRARDLEHFIEVCQPAQVATHAVQSGGTSLDLTTPSGRMVARQLGSVAQYEAEQKSARQVAANKQRASKGRHFGTRRCFGFEADGVTLRQAEADAIRQACTTVLNGGSLNEIARRWNAAGLYGPQGKMRLPADVAAEWERQVMKARENGDPAPRRPFVPSPWTGSVVGRTLRTARLAGLKTYRGQVVQDERGEPVAAEWPAIVPLDVWRAVQTVLSDPERRYPSAERQLLSGLAVCAHCGAPLQSGGTRNGRRRYRCSRKAGDVYREAEPIDEFVSRVVVARLAKADLARLFAPAATVDVDGIRQELADLGARQAAMAEAFADGAVTMAQLTAATKRMREQATELEARLPRPSSPALRTLLDKVGSPVGATPEAWAWSVAEAWAAIDQDAKRAVIDFLCVVRLVSPGTKENAYLDWRRRIVNPDTVQVEWR